MEIHVIPQDSPFIAGVKKQHVICLLVDDDEVAEIKEAIHLGNNWGTSIGAWNDLPAVDQLLERLEEMMGQERVLEVAAFDYFQKRGQ